MLFLYLLLLWTFLLFSQFRFISYTLQILMSFRICFLIFNDSRNVLANMTDVLTYRVFTHGGQCPWLNRLPKVQHILFFRADRILGLIYLVSQELPFLFFCILYYLLAHLMMSLDAFLLTCSILISLQVQLLPLLHLVQL